MIILNKYFNMILLLLLIIIPKIHCILSIHSNSTMSTITTITTTFKSSDNSISLLNINKNKILNAILYTSGKFLLTGYIKLY